jgi:DNA polymerase III subunit gamma/tau
MGQALYRKYRSKSLEEIIGQDHITKTLQNAIAKGRVSHAYLFTGPRGVGKTSIARILAHQLNDVPYTGEDSHLDIIEIDAASTGGVDEVRELREKVYVTPIHGKYKVYIIDEVHMMSTAAFNALLKTLEEPPAHVIFILATTEAHKLPATIISRTQRFTFRPIDVDKVMKHLRFIATEEKIDITDEALRLIAEHSDGSFRDSIGMLDQASSLHKKVGQTELENLLGIPSASAIASLLSKLQDHDTQGLITLLSELLAGGYQATIIAKELGHVLRQSLIENRPLLGKQTALTVLTKLLDVPASHSPEQLLELICLDASLATDSDNKSEDKQPKLTVAIKTPKQPDKKPSSKAKTDEESSEATLSQPINSNATELEASGDELVLTDTEWQAALQSLKKRSNTLYGIMKLGRPEFAAGRLTLTFNRRFHQKQASTEKNKSLVSGILKEITDHTFTLECIYDESVEPPITSAADQNVATPDELEPVITPIETISNIFGGAELLES